MTISSQPATVLLDSALKAESKRNEISVAVLDKAQELTRQQGAAMINLLEQSGIRPDSRQLDVYA
jgi:hypothetical protein